MTENKAIYRFKDLKHSYERAQKGSALQEVLNIFITLEDLDIAIKALEKTEKTETNKAEWKFDEYTAKFGNPYRCSNCDEGFGDTYNYCPNCGCQMSK